MLVNAQEQEIEIDAEMMGVYHLYPRQNPTIDKNYYKAEKIHLLL